MGECANLCENRWLFSLSRVNAPFTTIAGFLRVFPTRSWKTGRKDALMPRPKVKTELPPFVTSYRDRHGKMRYRFRRRGIDRQMPELGTAEFHTLYGSLLAGIAPPTKKVDPKNCVYFITDGHAIKIGFASCPQERIRTHQTSQPRRLRLMATAKGDHGLERLYHKRFAAHRIRGEWFELHDDILDEVARLRRGELPNEGYRST
jgi:hypothetical protein